jgi:pimeloyl-ACP methyl ester carboxylesterase
MPELQPEQSSEFSRVFSHTKAKVGDLHLHYVIGGEGDPLVLLHGFPQSWHMWRKVMLPLSKKYTLIVPDQRGSGSSDKPLTGYDGPTMAADIHSLVTQLGFKKLRVVGHDMGAPVALCYAAAHPENVRALVYLDEPLPGFNVEEMARFTADSPGRLWWYPFHMQPDLAELLLAGKEREYIDYFVGQHTHLMDPTAMTDEDRKVYALNLGSVGGIRGAVGWYRAVFETGAFIRSLGLSKLRLPVLGISGEYGTPNVGAQMKNVAENVSDVVIKGSGHFVAEEKPEEFVQELLRFFASCETG